MRTRSSRLRRLLSGSLVRHKPTATPTPAVADDVRQRSTDLADNSEEHHSLLLTHYRASRSTHSIVCRVSMSSASSSSSSNIFPSWHFASWTAVDDRVRGGSSRSHLDPVEVDLQGESTKAARFWGTLGEDDDFFIHLFTPEPDAVQISKRWEALVSLRSDTSSDPVLSVFPETSSRAYASPSSPTSSPTSSLRLSLHHMPERSLHTSPSSSKRRYGPNPTHRRFLHRPNPLR